MSAKASGDFEKQMARLQAIVLELEKGDLPLERNVALFKEGRTLALSCRELLQNARNEILQCTENGLEEFSARFADENGAQE